MMSALTYGQTYPHFCGADGQDTVSIYPYILERIECPEVKPGCIRPGTEVISFVVTSGGELTSFRVINSISRQLDKEMLELLEETSGRWQPACIDGEPVDMEHEVALRFVPFDFDPVQAAIEYLSKGNSLIYKNPRRSLRFINRAFRLFPCSQSILEARIVCKAELEDAQGVREDCRRIITLQHLDEHPHEVQILHIIHQP